ncbi:MAG: hypothetical protein ACRCV9_11665, partial [Burkholderiaceae bacterium]
MANFLFRRGSQTKSVMTRASMVSWLMRCGQNFLVGWLVLASAGAFAQTRVDNTATATLPPGVTTNGTTTSVSATDTDIVLRHTKVVQSGPTPTGTPNQFTITYRVRVENNNTALGAPVLPNGGTAIYGLTDSLLFAPGVTVNSASTANTGAGVPTGGALTPAAGPYTLAPAGTNLALNTAHQYDVTVTYTVGAVAAADASCGALGSAQGLRNRS